MANFQTIENTVTDNSFRGFVFIRSKMLESEAIFELLPLTSTKMDIFK